MITARQLTTIFFVSFPDLLIVLTSDYAVLLAEELGFKPIVDDEAAFDIYPPFVLFTISFYYNLPFLKSPSS